MLKKKQTIWFWGAFLRWLYYGPLTWPLSTKFQINKILILGDGFMGPCPPRLYPGFYGPRTLCRTYQRGPVSHQHHHHHHPLLFILSYRHHHQVTKGYFLIGVSSSPIKGSRFSATKLFIRKYQFLINKARPVYQSDRFLCFFFLFFADFLHLEFCSSL